MFSVRFDWIFLESQGMTSFSLYTSQKKTFSVQRIMPRDALFLFEFSQRSDFLGLNPAIDTFFFLRSM